MTTDSTLLANFEDWVSNEIPNFNNAIEMGSKQSDDLMAALHPWVRRLHAEISPGSISQKEARKAIQLIGFAVSSLERHYQSEKLQVGTAILRLGVVNELLSDLSIPAKHPPRDTHYTYWLWNNGQRPLTFTGDDQEIFFNRVVNRTHELHEDSCQNLRPLCLGELDLRSTEAALAVTASSDNSLELYERFRSFMSKDETHDRRMMEPQFFMTRMRTYLPTYPINGVTWAGVNAANLAAQMQLDYLVGVVLPEYDVTVRGRLPYLTEEDRKNLEVDMVIPSLSDRLIEELALTRESLEFLDASDLANYIFTQSVDIQRILFSYKKLVHANAKLSAIHWALIQNYLVKAAADLTAEEKAKLSVAPDRGTGGKTHAQTQAIMRMRKEHPIFGKLTAAIDIVEKAIPVYA